MAKKGGAKDKKPKEKVKKEGKKLSALFEISGDKITRKNRTCPKCGPGMFLGKHKDRLVCGKCKYVEMISKSAEVAEEVAEVVNVEVKKEQFLFF